MIKLLLIQNIFPSKGIEVVKAYSNISRMHENVGIKQSDTLIKKQKIQRKNSDSNCSNKAENMKLVKMVPLCLLLSLFLKCLTDESKFLSLRISKLPQEDVNLYKI